ncbi:MAG: ribonuclease P protein component [Heliobacteriaceae bacterium]|nr:ribonuclease P protein component [Heliobacteriaceae bacterium]
MLPRRCRLRRSKDFSLVYRQGKAFAGRYVVLYRFCANQRSGKVNKGKRIGFSVSSKVGKAVIRNRVKRILRAVCRGHFTAIKDGCDIILIARKKIKGIPFYQVEQDVIRLFKKSGLWTGG